MARIELTPTSLIVHVTGWDQIWSLKSQLEIPLNHVINVDLDADEAREWWKGWRMPGTNISGVITAGTFYKDGERVFWDVHNPDKAIAIHLAHDQYAKLVVEVDDPQETIAAIKRAQGESR